MHWKIGKTYCNEDECVLYSSFNYEDENSPLYCNLHKKTYMINVTSYKHKLKNIIDILTTIVFIRLVTQTVFLIFQIKRMIIFY
jgi:hypothetical protein